MKVTKKLLSIPPYLSTSWENVGALRVDNDPPLLIVQLIDGTNIQIPNLDRQTIQQIFLAHEQFLEEAKSLEAPQEIPFGLPEQIVGLPLRFGMGGFEGIGGPSGMMQHDPSQSGSPDLPDEMLEKVAGIAQVLGVGDGTQLPKAEQGCNCFHCQIARSLGKAFGAEEEGADEEVTEEDLAFRTWDIEDQGDSLFLVINPLDPGEKYNVFLGDPIGCTCGEKNCEHIRSVLKT